jgi:hypothetical protein
VVKNKGKLADGPFYDKPAYGDLCAEITCKKWANQRAHSVLEGGQGFVNFWAKSA